MSLSRRQMLTLAGAVALARPAQALRRARVIVVGGGFGGATAAKALRQMSGGMMEVLLIEPQRQFVSTPMSNLVVAGLRQPMELTRSYDALHRKHGVSLVHERVAAIDAEQRQVHLASGLRIRYDKLLLSPGVDMMWEAVEGLREAHDKGFVLQAWQGGAEALALRRQIEAMPAGGVLALTVPEAPLRCPPAPYERACLVAEWLKKNKPRAKLLLLDANEAPASEPDQFLQAFAERYAGIIDYRPQHVVTGIGRGVLRFEVQEDVRADLINLLPPMRAGDVAVQAGLANSNARWVNVHWRDFAATATEHIHVIGDAIQITAAMAKSGSMAQAQAQVVASAIVAELLERTPAEPLPLGNRCFSFVDSQHALCLRSEHRYSSEEQTWLPDPAAAYVAPQATPELAREAWAWAQHAWQQMLT